MVEVSYGNVRNHHRPFLTCTPAASNLRLFADVGVATAPQFRAWYRRVSQRKIRQIFYLFPIIHYGQAM